MLLMLLVISVNTPHTTPAIIEPLPASVYTETSAVAAVAHKRTPAHHPLILLLLPF